MNKKEALKTLGLTDKATENLIKERYKRLAQQTHPDKGGVLADFVKIKLAYEFLTKTQCPTCAGKGWFMKKTGAVKTKQQCECRRK